MRGSTNTQESSGPARRAQILAAAVAVFSRQGFASASIKDIAREAGVAPGLVHYYFASKEILVLDAIDAIEGGLLALWITVAGDAEDPLERILKGIDAIAASGIVDLQWSCTADEEAIRERSRLVWRHFQAAVEYDLRRVLGQLPAYGVSPREVAGVISSALSAMPMTSANDPDARTKSLNAIKIMLLSVVVAAHVGAGAPVPMEKIRALLPRG